MLRNILPVGAALLGASAVLADSSIPTCSLDKHCPESAPCCSQYGECGVGAYCLGGCDPRMSYSLDSCVPAPVCQSAIYPFTDTSAIVPTEKYLGDPKTAGWVSQGNPLPYNGNVLLTMPANSPGTVLASTTYMWYGNVKATLKTGKDAGVVTAFILLGDVKDEIDFEFVGTELSIAQTNYYFQGIPDYTHSTNITGVSNTNENFHTYEIQWTPDTITWLVDGNVGRVQKRSDTWNATANQWNYPQTPARVQISIWPGGASSNAQGTIDWAGGPINWNSSDIVNDGYYYMTLGQVEMECFNATSPPGTNTGVSYTYNNARATNDTVVDGDKPTVLKSFQGTGTDMNAGGDTSSSSSSSSASGTSTSTSAAGPAASIPGGSSGGQGSNGQAAGQAQNGNSGGSTTTAPANCAATNGFSQTGCGSAGTNDGRAVGVGSQERILGASAFAFAVAFVWLLRL